MKKCIVIGICHGLSVGATDISLATQATGNVYFRMGYATSASRMYVEEIKQETRTEGNDNKSLKTNISFNYNCFINK